MVYLLPKPRHAALTAIAVLFCSSVSVSVVARTLDESRLSYGAADGWATVRLQPGDADQDLDFDQVDLVQVQIAGKYLTGQPATWGQGDWNGAPGGQLGKPPAGDGQFDQLDIIASLAGSYLNGAYAAVAPGGEPGDGQTSIGYIADTGVIWIDAPAGQLLTSFEVQSASGIFTGQPARYVSLDSETGLAALSDVTSGSAFGSFSFGPVAEPGLAKEFLLGDLTVTGTLASGSGLGDVDLIYTVPEPSGALLAAIGLLTLLGYGVRRRNAA